MSTKKVIVMILHAVQNRIHVSVPVAVHVERACSEYMCARGLYPWQLYYTQDQGCRWPVRSARSACQAGHLAWPARLVSYPDLIPAAADGLHHRYAERGSGKMPNQSRSESNRFYQNAEHP